MTKKFSDTNDQRLYQRIKENDHEAFEKVFRGNYKTLYLFAENFVCDSIVAEDIVQNVFVRLWESDKKKDILNLKGYLYRSAKNACLTHLAHLQMIDKNRDKLVEALVYSQSLDVEEDPDLQKRVKDAIEKLPDQCQKVIYLKVYEGLKNEDIAKKMGISVNTVRTQVFRGYKMLRKHLSALYLITLFFK